MLLRGLPGDSAFWGVIRYRDEQKQKAFDELNEMAGRPKADRPAPTMTLEEAIKLGVL